MTSAQLQLAEWKPSTLTDADARRDIRRVLSKFGQKPRVLSGLLHNFTWMPDQYGPLDNFKGFIGADGPSGRVNVTLAVIDDNGYVCRASAIARSLAAQFPTATCPSPGSTVLPAMMKEVCGWPVKHCTDDAMKRKITSSMWAFRHVVGSSGRVLRFCTSLDWDSILALKRELYVNLGITPSGLYVQAARNNLSNAIDNLVGLWKRHNLLLPRQLDQLVIKLQANKIIPSPSAGGANSIRDSVLRQWLANAGQAVVSQPSDAYLKSSGPVGDVRRVVPANMLSHLNSMPSVTSGTCIDPTYQIPFDSFAGKKWPREIRDEHYATNRLIGSMLTDQGEWAVTCVSPEETDPRLLEKLGIHSYLDVKAALGKITKFEDLKKKYDDFDLTPYIYQKVIAKIVPESEYWFGGTRADAAMSELLEMNTAEAKKFVTDANGIVDEFPQSMWGMIRTREMNFQKYVEKTTTGSATKVRDRRKPPFS